MLIFKKQKNFENTPDAILNGKLTSLTAMKIDKWSATLFLTEHHINLITNFNHFDGYKYQKMNFFSRVNF